MTNRLGPLTPLPGEYLYPDSDDASKKRLETYNALSDADKLNRGGKWWSMFDLMKYFHSGILPEHGDTNFINFEIDFTSPELKRAESTDPTLKQEVMSSMTPGLQELSSKLLKQIADMKVAATTNVAAATSQGLMGRMGMGQQPQAPVQGGSKKKKTKGGAIETIEDLLNPMKLEEECLKDLFRIKLNSRNRIFITDSKKGSLALVETLHLPKAADIPDVLPDVPPAQNPPPAVGGRKNKTRKGRKHNKKGKTHRKQHRRK
jgi:hypothetical protein